LPQKVTSFQPGSMRQMERSYYVNTRTRILRDAIAVD